MAEIDRECQNLYILSIFFVWLFILLQLGIKKKNNNKKAFMPYICQTWGLQCTQNLLFFNCRLVFHEIWKDIWKRHQVWLGGQGCQEKTRILQRLMYIEGSKYTWVELHFRGQEEWKLLKVRLSHTDCEFPDFSENKQKILCTTEITKQQELLLCRREGEDLRNNPQNEVNMLPRFSVKIQQLSVETKLIAWMQRKIWKWNGCIWNKNKSKIAKHA